MEKIISTVVFIVILFIIYKFIEIRYLMPTVTESSKMPLKHFIRDTIMVGITSFFALYIMSIGHGNVTDFFRSISGNVSTSVAEADIPIFTGEMA